MSRSSDLVARDAAPGDHTPGISPVALSLPSCHLCAGLGIIGSRAGCQICACVYRRVFRACLASYHHCQAGMSTAGVVQYERVGHAQGKCGIIASFKRAEYAADFILLARRALAGHPVEMAIFEAYHLAGLEWFEAAKRANRACLMPRQLTRGAFFSTAYRAEAQVGKTIVGTRPYSLFPPRVYFAGFTISSAPLATSRAQSRR